MFNKSNIYVKTVILAGFMSLLFGVLKVFGALSWPWIWVLAPIFGCIFVGCLVVLYFMPGKN